MTLTDALPAGTTFASVVQNTGPTFSCVAPAVNTNGSVVCSIANLGPSTGATFTLTVNVAAAGTTITNTATASSATPDDVPANNSASATTTVLTGPDVSGTKSVTSPGPHVSGSQVQYTVVLTNNGATTQQDNPGNEFTDVLPAGLTLQSATASSGGDLGTLARGDLSPDLAALAFSLEAGGVSEPVLQGGGYRVLKVVEKKDGSTVPFAEAREEINKRLSQERITVVYEEYLAGLRKTALVDLKDALIVVPILLLSGALLAALSATVAIRRYLKV